jgi:hypothetical protein
VRFTSKRLVGVGAVTVAAALALSACAGGTTSSSSAAPKATGAAINLASVCPSTIVMQTDWNPEADHGHLYQMLGPNPTIDANDKTVTGDLMANGKSTGVKLQINSGGPAIGYSSVSQQMYKDKSIYMGYVSTDEALQDSVKLPTKAVFAETNISPQMVMWDPATYPNVTTIKELTAALTPGKHVIRYFNGAAYMTYMEGAGYVTKAVLDGSYDGTPAKFVAAKGADAQQGFATAEPYIYGKELSSWDKPVKFQLVYDTGYPIYPEAMSVRTADLTKDAPCLKKLVPIMQQADIDYIKNPTSTNTLITSLVTAYNNGWVYDDAVAKYAVAEMKKLKLIGNGPDGYLGEMTDARVQKIIDVDTPIFTSSGAAPKSGITPADLYTNEFLSKSIKY